MKRRLERYLEDVNKKIESNKRFNTLKKEFKNKNASDKDLKIIGVTGSRGKSTVAYIIHEYLKNCGYKSMLYSSLGIDSPSSIYQKYEACDLAISNKETISSMLEETKKYEADYLVVEVNESNMHLLKDMPMDVRVLTNFNPLHNSELYSEEEYKKLKLSFFKDVYDDNCVCVLGVGTMMTKEDYDDFYKCNNCKKVTFGTKHICEVRGIDYKKIDVLLHELKNNTNGLEMDVLIGNKNKKFNTKTLLAHNSINYVTTIASLIALEVFDETKFQKCIKDLLIPGREELINVNGRKIVIGMFLTPALENFKEYKNNKEIKNIKVVTGSVGTGFKNWSNEFKSEEFINTRKTSREYAMKIVDQYADYAYLTECDNAKEDVKEICKELQSYLLNTPSKIVVDRKEAIRQAIFESQYGDLIFISGRGNRKLLCYSEDKCKVLKDKDEVVKVLKEIGWM